jgi:hypothetical protein
MTIHWLLLEHGSHGVLSVMDGTLLSLAGFAVAMYITPGPNNVMLASSGANHGLRAVPALAACCLPGHPCCGRCVG